MTDIRESSTANSSGWTLDQGAADRLSESAHRYLRELITIDTSNPGDGSGPGERAAAERVAEWLTDLHLPVEVLESAPGRANVITRVAGQDRSRPALVVHGHLDVVPAIASDWSVPPFGAEEKDGAIWGRGAVDMKDMDAMILAALAECHRNGVAPARDLIVAFTADEEAGGVFGAHWLVDQHPELFDGATEAVSEVGGFSIPVRGRRAYLLQSAEKGILWLKITATGRAGHGSQINPENAITRLASAVAALGSYTWPRKSTPTLVALQNRMKQEFGIDLPIDDQAALQELLGDSARWIGATAQNTANSTVLNAGYKHNVIPGEASALIDCRFLAGDEEDVMATVRDLVGPDILVEVIHRDVALEAPHEGPLVSAMQRAVLAEDPEAVFLPYCLSGGTDNKALARLGITGYGFAPLRLPADLDFAALFHGVDERVPLDSLAFGARTMMRFLQDC